MDRRRSRVGEPRRGRSCRRARVAGTIRRPSRDAGAGAHRRTRCAVRPRDARARVAAVGRPRRHRWRFRARRRGGSHRRRADDQPARAAGVPAARVESRGVRDAGARAIRAPRSGRDARRASRGAGAFRERYCSCAAHARRRTQRPLRRNGDRLGALVRPALCGARRADPALRGSGACSRRRRRDVRARPCLRVPRDMGKHVPRREPGARAACGRARAGRVAYRARRARRCAGCGDPCAGGRKCSGLAALDRGDRTRRGHRAAHRARSCRRDGRAAACDAIARAARRTVFPTPAARFSRWRGARACRSVQLHAGRASASWSGSDRRARLRRERSDRRRRAGGLWRGMRLRRAPGPVT